ncbi:MAG: EscU/YscU/HrcU family type III secretion system export apparatus switch protein, partial [Candidatus Rokubacteria bacterium]|nr:EscU/YscU/HrcU family type III secretion system export apparatus switch protein [Candidatus Rokubacteria bacterium]
MADDRGERTEQPTGKRLSEARERGQIARSGEVGSAMTVLAAAGFLSWMGPSWADSLLKIIPLGFAELTAAPWEAVDAEQFFTRVLSRFLAATLPVVAAIAGLVLISSVLQGGFVLSLHPLKPDWSKLSPLQGLKNLFGTRGLVELAKAPLKLALLGGIAWFTVRGELGSVLTAAGRDPIIGARAVGALSLTLLWRLGLAHAALAALDYGYQRWSHRRGLRMTREEVKEEMKQAEGDPQIRARFRSLH